MQKKYLIGLIILLVLGVCFFKLRTPSKSSQTAVEQVNHSKSLYQRAQQHPGLLESHLSEAEVKDQSCKATLVAIETLPLDTLIYDIKENKLQLKDECLFLTAQKSNVYENFVKACSNRQADESVFQKECVWKLFVYKANRIHEATKNDSLDRLSIETIIMKFMAMLSGAQDMNEVNLKSMRVIGNEIQKRLPDSSSAAKAALVGYISDSHKDSQTALENDRLLEEARQKFPDDWAIYEMDLVNKKIKNDGSYKKSILDDYSKNPNSAITNYHMGCISWAESKASEAQAYFRAAIEQSPSEQRFKDTLQKSQVKKAPDSVCTVNISFDPEKF